MRVEAFLEVSLPSLEALLENLGAPSWRIAFGGLFQQAKECSSEFVSNPVELGARRTN